MQKISEAYLPDAGKPDGLCPDCGPHGNAGLIELLFSVASCVECERRAQERAEAKAADLVKAAKVGMPEGSHVDIEVLPSAGRSWARTVRVMVTAPETTEPSSINHLGIMAMRGWDNPAATHIRVRPSHAGFRVSVDTPTGVLHVYKSRWLKASVHEKAWCRAFESLYERSLFDVATLEEVEALAATTSGAPVP